MIFNISHLIPYSFATFVSVYNYTHDMFPSKVWEFQLNMIMAYTAL